MNNVKWIKITTDIFDDEKILLIESMPERDCLIVIWFKLLCLAGKQNNSGVFMINDRMPYTDEMLSTILRRPLNTVRLALSVFEQYGMIEIIENVITIPNWGKHQSLDQLENKKEYMREYMREYREKQKAISCKTNSKTNVSSLDKDIDKELEKDLKEDIKYIVEYLNSKAGTKFKPENKETQKHITGRLNDGYTVEDFKIVIDKKCDEWMGTEWEKYLRPSTLFIPTNFENYLNAKVVKSIKNQSSNKERAF